MAVVGLTHGVVTDLENSYDETFQKFIMRII